MFSDFTINELILQQLLCAKIVKSVMDKSSDHTDLSGSQLNDVFVSDSEVPEELQKAPKARRRKPRKKRKLSYCSDLEWGSDEDEQPAKKRQAFERSSSDPSFEDDLVSFSDSDNASGRRAMKNYQLRPRVFLRRPLAKRENLEEERLSPEIFTRGRGRAAQLSKYRRRTANARERHRMKEINAAFATLRGVLPRPIRVKESTVTKIMTLRMAVDYIRTLDTLLNDGEMSPTSYCGTMALTSDQSAIPTDSVSFEQMVLEISSASMSKCKGHGDDEYSNKPSDLDRFSKLSGQCSFNYSSAIAADEIPNIEDDPIALLLSEDVQSNFKDILSSE